MFAAAEQGAVVFEQVSMPSVISSTKFMRQLASGSAQLSTVPVKYALASLIESLIGRPEDFVVTVREIEIAAGAGFIIPILGKMMRMPGLPSQPATEHMYIDDNGVISGLS